MSLRYLSIYDIPSKPSVTLEKNPCLASVGCRSAIYFLLMSSLAYARRKQQYILIRNIEYSSSYLPTYLCTQSVCQSVSQSQVPGSRLCTQAGIYLLGSRLTGLGFISRRVPPPSRQLSLSSANTQIPGQSSLESVSYIGLIHPIPSHAPATPEEAREEKNKNTTALLITLPTDMFKPFKSRDIDIYSTDYITLHQSHQDTES
ncbi:hypothetical protein GGR53DRAFT_125732 [Hypoxylon sp. FL1150]|nr:hypothetical protein GGR53DRAFT_125732 [Hypoxylon sp. FL1150]